MNKGTTIGLLAAGGTVTAGAVWLGMSGPKVNQGGLRVIEGQVLPPTVDIDESGQFAEYEAEGDQNVIIGIDDHREYAIGTYDAEAQAYKYVTRFYRKLGSTITKLQQLIPADTWQALVRDYAASGYRKIRPGRFCTPAEVELFRSFLRIALAFGHALRLMGHASVATGRVTAFVPGQPNLRTIIYVGQLNPMCAGVERTSSTMRASWDWAREGQAIVKAFVDTYSELIPLGADNAVLEQNFRQETSEGGREMQGTMGAAPIMWAIGVGIVLILGAVAYVVVVFGKSLCVFLFGEAAMADEYEENLDDLIDCMEDPETTTEARAACERQYQATMNQIRTIDTGMSSLTKWVGVGVIGAIGLGGGYLAYKATRKT